MSTSRQSAANQASWATLDPDERRARTAPAVAKSVERRRRSNLVMNAFEDALESAGLRLVPVDDTEEQS